MKLNIYRTLSLPVRIAAVSALMIFGVVADMSARPVTKAKGTSAPLNFFRQRNNLSNIDFFFTNKGVLFNNDAVAGCNWPRGTANSYIYGGGVWFATKKNISGKRKKLCELGYNPNSGAGWFTEGEIGNPDPSSADAAKYVSYVSPRYSKETGKYDGVLRTSVSTPAAVWPIWDTSISKTLNRNYYFGDYISSLAERERLSGLASSNTPLPNSNPPKVPKPAMLSQEDIVNVYSDQDVTANPEYKTGSGYPFKLNVVEVINSWSFGKYRDMIFLRRKVTNASTSDTLYECFISQSYDPDLGVGSGPAGNDHNSYYGLTPADIADCKVFFKPDTINHTHQYYDKFYNDPTSLNLARQWSESEASANPPGQYGCIGFAFLESPITAPNGDVLDISDSAAVGGYCNGYPQLGLKTFKQWTLNNDPPTPDLRYDFLSDGSKGIDEAIGGAGGADMRLLFATGPFTLGPLKSVETTVAIGIARPSTTTLKLNKDSVVKLIAFAHHVFSDTGGSYLEANYLKTQGDSSCASSTNHFITPVPPEIPQLSTQCLDRAIIVSWDQSSDNSKDPLSPTLPFNTYELYRTTRSDHDSTIRPDGINPIVKLGTWSIWDLRQDSIIQVDSISPTKKFRTFLGFRYTRTNSVPNKIPHSFLDVGDDNRDGTITGSEGLFNGVKYYYFLLATDEFDSVNKVGPLTTAIVTPQNFIVGIPCRPIFPDLPNVIAGDSSCLNGAVAAENNSAPTKGTSVSVHVQDTGKFLQLYSNDEIKISFQPRWLEYGPHRFLHQSPLNMFVDVTDTRQLKELTYDKLFNPNATPVLTPYSFPTGLVQQVIGMNPDDTNRSGRFTTNNSLFAPNQTIDQAFDVLVDFEYKQLKAPYTIHSITVDGKGSSAMIGISGHTSRAPQNVNVDYANIDEAFTRPSFLGALGEVSYEISFGSPEAWNELQFDTVTGKVVTMDHITGPNGEDFRPQALPITIKSKTHCDQALKVIRPGNRNDIVYEGDAIYYNHTVPAKDGSPLPDNGQPDSIIVPIPGKFAMDAFHFIEDDPNDPGTASFITKTIGKYYFPTGTQSGGKYLATVHRLRLAGAEIILNYPNITNNITGDTINVSRGTFASDFQPGDKITINFTGLVKGLPFPGTEFIINTSKDKKFDFSDNNLYKQSKILDEVQVVPNPYIVQHLGQTSTDNAKLFFTRLPPRATIEIYNIAGELIKTLEHNGVASVAGDGSVNLADRYNVEEWNLLSEGRQRVGSQVFIARVIAKDVKDGTTVLGETTVKFAVVLGGYRQVR